MYTRGSGDYGNGNIGGGNSDNGSVPWFGRCGGEGYKGPTSCRYGKCVKFNPWFSMCF